VDATLLLSGGIDSTAIAYWKRPRVAITVDYGQAAAVAEIQAASRVAAELKIVHEVVHLDLAAFGAGTLIGKQPSHVASTPEWWPFRNQLLVTVAGMAAIRNDCSEVWIGTVASDGQRHSDGTLPFVQSLSRLMELQEGSIRLVAPALNIASVKLVQLAGISAEDLALCHSCHTGPLACGTCAGCLKATETRIQLNA
jgi:7-cyano-7-deazaguanine synthase